MSFLPSIRPSRARMLTSARRGWGRGGQVETKFLQRMSTSPGSRSWPAGAWGGRETKFLRPMSKPLMPRPLTPSLYRPFAEVPFLRAGAQPPIVLSAKSQFLTGGGVSAPPSSSRRSVPARRYGGLEGPAAIMFGWVSSRPDRSPYPPMPARQCRNHRGANFSSTIRALGWQHWFATLSRGSSGSLRNYSATDVAYRPKHCLKTSSSR